MRSPTLVPFVAALLLYGMLAGCASNSNYYSAKPVGDGNIQLLAAVSTIDTRDAADTVLATVIRPDFGIFELGAMLGLNERFDIGVKYSFPTAGFVEGKYALVGAGKEKGFFLAPGFRVGYTAFPESPEQKEENSRIELAVPLLVSLYPADWLGLTLIPTYSFRYFTALEGYGENIAGGNINLRLGGKFGFFVEGAAHRNFKWEWVEVQGGLGLYITFNEFM